jgi:hypothetical protein
MLNWKPMYRHSKVIHPPKTILTALTGFDVFKKLSPYLAFEIDLNPPAGGWNIRGAGHRHLFQTNGFHHTITWMPKLADGWRRLTYQEFCAWYGLECKETTQ